MFVSLLHGSTDWIIAGGLAFIGISYFLIRLMLGHVIQTIVSLVVWILLFKIHGGTVAGTMTATLAVMAATINPSPLVVVVLYRAWDWPTLITYGDHHEISQNFPRR